MASKKEFEPNPDQGTLFNLNTPNLEPALTDQQSFRIEPGPSISVEERSRRLIEALYVLGRMSSNSGFNKAQFSQTENEKLYYKYGTYGIEDVNKKIDGAKLAKERKLRNIFMAGRAIYCKTGPQIATIKMQKAIWRLKNSWKRLGDPKTLNKGINSSKI